MQWLQRGVPIADPEGRRPAEDWQALEGVTTSQQFTSPLPSRDQSDLQVKFRERLSVLLPARRLPPLVHFANGRQVMIPRTENAIKFAVACCIYQCANSPAPFTCLESYLDGLQKGGWDDDALSHVKRDVLRAIHDAAVACDEMSSFS
jgi:hypothetical protein